MPSVASISNASLKGLLAIHRYRLLSVDQFSRASQLKPSHVRDLLRTYERQHLLGSIGNVGLRGGSKAPKLYYLTKSGYAAMLDAGGFFPEDIGYYVRPHTSTRWTPIMAHRMATIDLLLSVEQGLATQPEYRLVRALHEYRRIRHGNKPPQPETSDFVAEPFDATTRVVPDAGFILEKESTGVRALFFIETDRGTERLTSGSDGSYSIVEKFKLYERYLSGGRFAKTYVGDGDFKFFTLLFVTTSEARIENARRACSSLNANFHPYFKFATLAAAKDNFFAPTWLSRDASNDRRSALIKTN